MTQHAKTACRSVAPRPDAARLSLHLQRGKRENGLPAGALVAASVNRTEYAHAGREGNRGYAALPNALPPGLFTPSGGLLASIPRLSTETSQAPGSGHLDPVNGGFCGAGGSRAAALNAHAIDGK
jgi:hypothetical protein